MFIARTNYLQPESISCMECFQYKNELSKAIGKNFDANKACREKGETISKLKKELARQKKTIERLQTRVFYLEKLTPEEAAHYMVKTKQNVQIFFRQFYWVG